MLITHPSFLLSCPNPNLALSPAARGKQLPLFSENNLDPFPSTPVCFALVHLSGFRVLTLSLLLATPWPVFLEFSLLFSCSSGLDPLQPWVSGTSPSGLIPSPHPTKCVHVWVGGEGLDSILGLKNYNWFPMIREMQIETIHIYQISKN